MRDHPSLHRNGLSVELALARNGTDIFSSSAFGVLKKPTNPLLYVPVPFSLGEKAGADLFSGRQNPGLNRNINLSPDFSDEAGTLC